MNERTNPMREKSDRVACDACGARAVQSKLEQQKFPYGKAGEQVELTAQVLVWKCDNCGFAFTDDSAEMVRHDAVCLHLGVLTPSDIRALRARYVLSQADLADLTGFGEATIKRWELGLNIQNASADRFLRLLKEREVFERLVLMRPLSNSKETLKYQFRTKLPATVAEEAKFFKLRPATELLSAA